MFHNILERTNVFLRYKSKTFKKSKHQNFPKGLVHGFSLKWSIFPSFCFREKTPGRCVSRYSRKKKRLSTLKKQEVQKVENFYFCSLYILGNIGQEDVFYDILEWKNIFLDHENNDLKKLKNWNFFKGVSQWFWSKIGNFSTIIF